MRQTNALTRIALPLAILLLAAAFRLVGITEAPPGWRDDELLDVMMNSRVGDDYHPIYFAEQEGHEPLQHYVVWLLYRLMGRNLVSNRWLSVMSGILSVALMFPLGRRLFDSRVAAVGAALMAVGLWPLMYARFGLRHIFLVPMMMACWYGVLYGLDRLREGQRSRWAFLAAGLALGAGLLTYYAARVMPAILVVFALYLLLLARERHPIRQKLAGLLLTLAIGGLVAAPMLLAIARLPGGEDRLQVVGAPLIELLAGEPQQALETTLGTLAMFTWAGDPEWLYNLMGRPVFDWFTGIMFYLGVALAIWRWRQPRAGFVLIWLLGGLGPAFISVPAASFGHAIVALPIVYLLAASGAVQVADRVRLPARAVTAGLVLLVVFNAVFHGLAYGVEWNQNRWVRFLYHADVHDLAGWLDDHPEVTDLAVTSLVTQQKLDRLALELDVGRSIDARWFDPAGALVWPHTAGGSAALHAQSSAVYETTLLDEWTAGRQPVFDGWGAGRETGFAVYQLERPAAGSTPLARFDGGLALLDWSLAAAGDGVNVRTWWLVESDLTLPVKQFTHLEEDGMLVVGTDRFDAYAPSLQAGDLVLQQVHISAPVGSYELRLGIYDPAANERWHLVNEDADSLWLGPVEVAP